MKKSCGKFVGSLLELLSAHNFASKNCALFDWFIGEHIDVYDMIETPLWLKWI